MMHGASRPSRETGQAPEGREAGGIAGALRHRTRKQDDAPMARLGAARPLCTALARCCSAHVRAVEEVAFGFRRAIGALMSASWSV